MRLFKPERRRVEICTVANLAPEIPQSPKCGQFGNKNTPAPLLLAREYPEASRLEEICVSETSAQRAMIAAAIDDMTLVHASKAGDIAAFEELVKRYDRQLLRIAQHVTHNREDAQDAVQEAFLKASKAGTVPGKFKILNLAGSHRHKPVAHEVTQAA